MTDATKPDIPKSDPRPNMVAGQPTVPKNKLPDRLAAEPTVTMIFPHDVTVNLDNYEATVRFEKGTQEVPTSLSKHPYLKDNGVELYQKAASKNATSKG